MALAFGSVAELRCFRNDKLAKFLITKADWLSISLTFALRKISIGTKQFNARQTLRRHTVRLLESLPFCPQISYTEKLAWNLKLLGEVRCTNVFQIFWPGYFRG